MKENLYKFVFDKGSSKNALVALVFLSDLIEFKIIIHGLQVKTGNLNSTRSQNLAPCNQQFHQLQQQQKSSSSSIINRKSNNSWVAQSFRKAFGKIENRRKNNQLNKSQVQLNKSLKAMSSTFSVNTNMNDYEYLSTGGSSQRNSCSSSKTNQISTSSNCSESGGSRRSSLSDDENVMPQSAYHSMVENSF